MTDQPQQANMFLGSIEYCLKCHRATEQRYTIRQFRSVARESPIGRAISKQRTPPRYYRVLRCVVCGIGHAHHKYIPRRFPRGSDGTVSEVYFD